MAEVNYAQDYAQVKATTEAFNNQQGQDIRLLANNRGDALMAQSLPPKAELVRMGNTWECRIATGSAFTYVNAWPTTRGELVLYNGEATGGKSYVIDSAWLYNISSMAAAQHQTLIAQVVPTATAPTNDTAQLISSMSSKTATYSGNALRAVANTAMGQTTNLWSVIATSQASAMTTNLGAALYAELYGKFIIKPGAGFALAGIAGTAAGTAIIGVCWHEVQLALG